MLKAGGAYVPLDPAYPQERLAFMLDDSRVAVLLTQSELDGRPAAHGGARGQARRGPGGHRAAELRAAGPGVAPGILAYVIYTSGSTGRPKGVLVTPRATSSRLFAATEAWFGFGPDDVWTLFHSYAFDFSVWEIWGALLYGGRLVVVPYWVSRSPEAFYELLRRERRDGAEPDAVGLPPAHLGRGGGATARPSRARLRWRCVVIFGGEALELASLAPWFERHGDGPAAAGQHVRHHRDHRPRDLPAARPGRRGARRAAA